MLCDCAACACDLWREVRALFVAIFERRMPRESRQPSQAHPAIMGSEEQIVRETDRSAHAHPAISGFQAAVMVETANKTDNGRLCEALRLLTDIGLA